MKARLSISVLVLLLAVLWPHASSSNAKLNFEKALLLEEASGQLQEAIALYQKVVTEATGDEALAAQAQLHVGMCYEKLANQEARKAYQVVVDKYPSQQEAVRIARQRLASLRSGHQVGQTVTVREFMRSSENVPGKISDPTIDASEFVSTRDGQTFIYTDWMTGDLVAKNFRTGKTQALYNVTWDNSEEYFQVPVLSDDEKRLAYVNYSWANGKDVVRLGIDAVQGGNRGVLYESKANLYPHDWSPDGSTILVSLEAPARSISLTTVGTQDKKVQRLVTLDWEYPRRAAYSPDGRFIAYDSTKDGNRKIYLMASNGLQERVLADSPGENDSPLWTRDGRFLLFRSSRSGDCDLFALPIQDGQPMDEPLLIKANIGEGSYLRATTTEGKLLYGEFLSASEIAIMKRSEKDVFSTPWILPKIGTRQNSHPNFAPDGKSLAYVAGAPRKVKRILRIAALDGKILKEVSFPEVGVSRPIFSPDGKRIALQASDRKRQGKILLVSVETGTLLKVLGFEPDAGYPAHLGWSKDSRLLYVKVRSLQLEAIDVETETRTSSPLPRNITFYPAISPDGNSLACTVSQESPSSSKKGQIVLRSLIDGTDKVLRTDELAGSVVWDFDSKHLFYMKSDKDRTQLCKLSIENGVEQSLLKDLKNLALRDVSRDGKYLALQKDGGDARIWVVENFLPKAKPELAAR